MAATIILAFAESLSAPEVAWSLADRGFTVVALARRGRSSALRHSRFARVVEITPPASDFAAAMADLKAICAQLQASASPVGLMPLDDEAIWLSDKMEFDRHIVVIGPRGPQAELALNKQRQIELARESGLSVPRTRYIERPDDFPSPMFEFPLVFKPAHAVTVTGQRLSKGHGWICSDRMELESAIAAWAGRCPMLLQEFIAGTGEGVFGLATSEGVVAWSAHRRLRMMNPHGSGSSACAAAPPLDPGSHSAAEHFLRRSGWRGLFMIELLRDVSGQLWFIEFNGRSWGSMALARRSGLDYPAWAATFALGQGSSLKLPGQRNESLVCRHLGRELLHLLFVLRGPKSKALQAWPSAWRTIFQLCRLGQNQRWYNWRRDDPKVFLADACYTIRDQLFKPAARP